MVIPPIVHIKKSACSTAKGNDMPKFGEFDDREIQNFFKNFAKNANRNDVKLILEKHLTKVGNIVRDETKARTPVKSGDLRRGWKKTNVSFNGQEASIEIYNNIEYAGFMEEGHRIVRGGKTVGYVEGRKMLATAIHDAEALIEQAAQDAIDEITEKLLGGL